MQADCRTPFLVLDFFGRFLLACLLAIVCLAEIPDDCKARLRQGSTKLDDAYKIRGDRCEGVLNKSGLSGGTAELRVLGFHGSLGAMLVPANRSAEVEWRSKGGSKLRIAVVAKGDNLLYRMDTLQPVDAAVYKWDSSLIQRLQLTPDTVDVLAWEDNGAQECASDHRLYVPLFSPAQADQPIVLELTIPRGAKTISHSLTRLPNQVVRRSLVNIPSGRVQENARFLVSIDPKVGAGKYRLDLDFDKNGDLPRFACVQFLMP